MPYINILYSKTPCSCPKFGAGLNIKLRVWDKCQVTENAPISKNEYVTLCCLVKTINEYGAMVDWGLADKNRRSSKQNCFSAFYPPPVSHNVTGDWTWCSIVIQIKCLCMHTMICGLCLPEIVTAVKTHNVLSSITPCDLPWRWKWYFFLNVWKSNHVQNHAVPQLRTLQGYVLHHLPMPYREAYVEMFWQDW